jgi:hypothetical protein
VKEGGGGSRERCEKDWVIICYVMRGNSAPIAPQTGDQLNAQPKGFVLFQVISMGKFQTRFALGV